MRQGPDILGRGFEIIVLDLVVNQRLGLRAAVTLQGRAQSFNEFDGIVDLDTCIGIVEGETVFSDVE